MNNYDSIPDKLKALPQWVCYTLRPRADGKKDKIPMNAKIGTPAKSNDPGTWTDFGTAVRASKQYDGIGIMFSNGLCGIDCDDCVLPDGTLSEPAATIVLDMKSYAETSISGKGVHILFFGAVDDDARFYKKNPHNHVEIYGSGRFFTVSGNRIGDFDVSERTAECKAVQEHFMLRDSDEPLIGRIKASPTGEKFTRLYGGDTAGYGSHSEADLALCSIIARFCGDAETVDRVFRKSGLYREEKWNRRQSGTTYGAITVAKAIEGNNTPPPSAAALPIQWEQPIPFSEFKLPAFPTDALPKTVRDYVLSVAAATQTAPDMAATAALAVIALAVQGKMRIQGKTDWSEPLNLYTVIVASPAERKSAVMNYMTGFVSDYESGVNKERDAEIITSQMLKGKLERERRSLEDAAAKGNASFDDMKRKAQEISEFDEVKPLKLFVDDITSEKLSSVLAENNGRMAVVSAEGGIFDILSGIYTRTVNIDVFLKGHSGDQLRVDRIGRGSENVINPALTVLLSVQPSVLAGLMCNETFRGRGLTARFLYSMPESRLGSREFETPPIPAEASDKFKAMLTKLLGATVMENKTSTIFLSKEAYALFADFSRRLEPRLIDDLADMADWAGKLCGEVLRIAGVLYAADMTDIFAYTELRADTMRAAIAIGEYYLEHAKAAYTLMGADPVVKQCEYLIGAVTKANVKEFSRRDIMRLCRQFKTAEALQPVLTRLTEYGYIVPKSGDVYSGTGRPASESYLVNPMLLSA